MDFNTRILFMPLRKSLFLPNENVVASANKIPYYLPLNKYVLNLTYIDGCCFDTLLRMSPSTNLHDYFYSLNDDFFIIAGEDIFWSHIGYEINKLETDILKINESCFFAPDNQNVYFSTKKGLYHYPQKQKPYLIQPFNPVKAQWSKFIGYIKGFCFYQTHNHLHILDNKGYHQTIDFNAGNHLESIQSFKSGLLISYLEEYEITPQYLYWDITSNHIIHLPKDYNPYIKNNPYIRNHHLVNYWGNWDLIWGSGFWESVKIKSRILARRKLGNKAFVIGDTKIHYMDGNEMDLKMYIITETDNLERSSDGNINFDNYGEQVLTHHAEYFSQFIQDLKKTYYEHDNQSVPPLCFLQT